MKHLRRMPAMAWIPVFIAGGGMTSCVQPASPPPAVAEPKTEFKKPVRMNDRGEVNFIELDRFYELHQSGKALVYDARLPFFYHLGHIPGAVNLPRGSCDALIHEREAEIRQALAEGRTIVVYCTGITCPDARTVARHISGFGYPASVFSGGWDAWKEAGLDQT